MFYHVSEMLKKYCIKATLFYSDDYGSTSNGTATELIIEVINRQQNEKAACIALKSRIYTEMFQRLGLVLV